jgi:hypothetical protein
MHVATQRHSQRHRMCAGRSCADDSFDAWQWRRRLRRCSAHYFRCSHARQRHLDLSVRAPAQIVRKAADGGIAIASACARPESRVLVDHYLPGPDGSYMLGASSIDLLSYLCDAQIHLLPSLDDADKPARLPKSGGQSTNAVLMVAPTAFGFNDQVSPVATAASLMVTPVRCQRAALHASTATTSYTCQRGASPLVPSMYAL